MDSLVAKVLSSIANRRMLQETAIRCKSVTILHLTPTKIKVVTLVWSQVDAGQYCGRRPISFEKIQKVVNQNNIRLFIVNKDQINKNYIHTCLNS